MERKSQRKYPVLEQLTTEELEKLLAQDFAATGDEEPDAEYIMAIMGVIKERETAAGHGPDVDAAWKDFQEEYQGQAAAFDRTIRRETESSDHQQNPPAQASRKKSHIRRFVLVAAAVIVLLCGTASGFGRAFQAVVNWTAETFGFAAPYGGGAGENAERSDPYHELRVAVAEYTDLSVIPNWAPKGTTTAFNEGVKRTERRETIRIAGKYIAGDREFAIQIQIHDSVLSEYTFSYQWNEELESVPYVVHGLEHTIVYNYENHIAAWTHENVECVIQGDLSVEELQQMIDSIYEERSL